MYHEKSLEQGKLRTALSARKTKVIGGAVVLAAVVGGGAWSYFDRSGEVEVTKPTKPIPENINPYHVQLSWNMFNQTDKRWKQVRSLIRKYQVDVAMLQEVSHADSQKIGERFPEMHKTFVMADKKSQPANGGYGNLLITSQKPRDIKSISLSGSSIIEGSTQTAAAGVKYAYYLGESDQSPDDEWQADRSAVAATISVRQGEELKDIRVITGHIAGNEKVHDKQLDSLLKFVKDETKEDRPTIFCGDLNDTPENVIPRFASIGFITPQTAGTWAGESHNTIDYCSYTTGGAVLGLGSVAVLNEPYVTDHHSLVGAWTTRLPEER